MERNTLEKFFTGKTFVVPAYQRDYAWQQGNIDDLLDDLAETIETKTSHYIGTFILSRLGSDGAYHVVDGQQRLTTLTLVLNAVVSLLPEEQKIIYRNTFLMDIGKRRWRLVPAEYNRDFFIQLLEGKAPHPQSKSQRLLARASEYIQGRIAAVYKTSGNSIEQYLDSLKNLEVMEFIEADEGKAIRIFQTVNDRGRPLSIIEKAKSLLIYYSNRFLQGQLDTFINESFGKMFAAFSHIKEIGESSSTRIDLVAQASFSEDSVLRYHFLAFPNTHYDFKPTVDYVLDGFLKRILRELQPERDQLAKFIATYVADVTLFFEEFQRVLERTTTDPRYFKLFCVLGISTHLYPLTIRLARRDLLDQRINGSGPLTFLNLVETADVRIYKTRNTDPAKDISYLACDTISLAPAEISKKLRAIVGRFMDDAAFESALNGEMYSNEAVLHILCEAGEQWAISIGQPPLSVSDLMVLMATKPTIEHVFSQIPTFAFPSRGFTATEVYELENDKLGNLCVLEKDLNSRCQNKTPEQKLNDVVLYKQSHFRVTKQIVADVAAAGKAFEADEIGSRTKAIAKSALSRWPLWPA